MDFCISVIRLYTSLPHFHILYCWSSWFVALLCQELRMESTSTWNRSGVNFWHLRYEMFMPNRSVSLRGRLSLQLFSRHAVLNLHRIIVEVMAHSFSIISAGFFFHSTLVNGNAVVNFLGTFFLLTWWGLLMGRREGISCFCVLYAVSCRISVNAIFTSNLNTISWVHNYYKWWKQKNYFSALCITWTCIVFKNINCIGSKVKLYLSAILNGCSFCIFLEKY